MRNSKISASAQLSRKTDSGKNTDDDDDLGLEELAVRRALMA
jgi:hypothetical protein